METQGAIEKFYTLLIKWFAIHNICGWWRLKLLCFSMWSARSSHRSCSVKKSIIGNLTKFTGKHLCQSLFFNKAAGLRPPFYRTPLGDCFWSPEKARTGCSYDLQKDESVDHIQKRIGTALREYKRKMKWIRLTDGKSVLGNGRLTDAAINKI